MAKYLDATGLSHLWDKIKAYVQSNATDKVSALETQVAALEAKLGVVLPVVSFDGIDPYDCMNLSTPSMDGLTEVPVFFDTFDEADNYGGYNSLFTPTGIYWCAQLVPYTNETVYGQHRFFLIGTRAVPLTAGGSITQTVAVKAWEDGDVPGYPGSWAYNEDDAADGYARRGVLFRATDGTLYYRAYGSDSVLTELVVGS